MKNVLKSEEKYWRENDAKFRALAQNTTYEQFEDIVKASHLKPLENKDKAPSAKVRSSIWNTITLTGKKTTQENTSVTQPPTRSTPTSIKNIDEFCSSWRGMEIEERIDFVSEVGEGTLNRIFHMEIPPELIGEMLHTFLAFRPNTKDIAAVVKTLGGYHY